MANITFVDEDDKVIGHGSRQEALEKGLIHRVSRVIISNSKKELLLQKRAAQLSSNPNLWDQSASGHVDEGEEYHEAAVRELEEEVGIANVPLTEIGKYYTEDGDEQLPKKRFNTVFIGSYEGKVTPSLSEVSEVRWISAPELKKWIEEKPQEFTQGFLKCMEFYWSRS